jgi:hypothetical protein
MTTIEQTPIAIWTTDRELRLTSTAGAGLSWLGVRPNEGVGVTIYDYFGTQPGAQNAIEKHRSALQGDEVEYELEWQDQIFRSYLQPLRDGTGSVVGVVGVAFDITKSRRSEAALRESDQTFRSMIEYNPDIVAILVDGRYRYINETLLSMTGYTREQIIGRPALDIIHPDDRARGAERLRLILEGDTPRPSEYRVVRADGTLIPVEIMAQKITYKGAPAIFGLMRDISRHKRIEEESRRRNEELARLVEERTRQFRELEQRSAAQERLAATGRMAARIAHEINNPLAGIKSAFQLIRGSVPPTHPHFQFVGLIDREIGRIANITQLMFRLYRPDHAEWQVVSVEDVIRDVVAMVSLTADRRSISIRAEALALLRLRLPSGYLEQILYNLIRNAVDVTPDGGEVTVSAGPSADGMLISVLDRGPGVPEEIGDRIFEPFYSSKPVEGSSGLGLGLSVTRTLVETLKGRISFSSRPGGGTIFNVSLPLDVE